MSPVKEVVADAPSLVSKLARIANAIGDKDPIRHSRDIKFPYHAARDVYGWWRPLLQDEGIILIPDVTRCDVMQATLPRSGGGTRVTFLTTIQASFTIIDGATGEKVEGSAVGQGEDPSDKGAGKAMTYAEKAFLLGMGMNGSESDVEAYADYEDIRTSRETRDVVVEDSNIEGIARGGRSTNATDVQVKRVRNLAGELGYGVNKSVGLVKDVLDLSPRLPEEPDDQGPAFVRFLEGLSADEIGRLIQYMEKMLEPTPRDDSGY